ncbi:DUF6884 domain-containing protein [Streptomyces sp. NPDC058758]|uniref:DUF6884 domain-containing protein n=1 Tax=Streptomyces sp. NPDC058758 TaxID=3346627 RepID=UPI0036A2108C
MSTSMLSPTGAKILDSNDGGLVTGHPAALAKLEGDRLIVKQVDGTRRMTAAGRAALDAWREANPSSRSLQSLPASVGVLPKLPERQHEAVLTAARRPDQLVAGRDDARGENRDAPWFRESTLRKVNQAGYANIRPETWDTSAATWEDTGRSLYLTELGREYARQRGGIKVRRRRVVIIACGQKKQPDPGVNEYGNPLAGYPAGELYVGDYHRSLRGAADALTDPSLVFIASALHGLVPLAQPLHPYDVRVGEERAVTAEKMGQHTARLGLDDADVIFLGGKEYADLLRPSVPHLYAPLAGGMGIQRGQCARAREDAALRAAWWKAAAALYEQPPAAAPAPPVPAARARLLAALGEYGIVPGRELSCVYDTGSAHYQVPIPFTRGAVGFLSIVGRDGSVDHPAGEHTGWSMLLHDECGDPVGDPVHISGDGSTVLDCLADSAALAAVVADWITAPVSRHCDCYAQEGHGRPHDRECNRYRRPARAVQ